MARNIQTPRLPSSKASSESSSAGSVLPERFNAAWFAQFAAFLAPYPRLIVAVSGGADSLALLDLARALEGHTVIAATVDHGLRADASQEIDAVAALCQAWGVPHHVLRIVEKPAEHGVQEWARNHRYALLADAAKHHACDAILVAHHQDDQAETLLHRLAAGSGLSGLAGMAMRSERVGTMILRPLLDVPKADLVAYCQSRMIPFAEDASNHNPRFMRSRLRASREALEREGLSAQRLATLARRIARADAALDQRADALLAHALNGDGTLNWTMLDDEPDEIRLRVLKRTLEIAQSQQNVMTSLPLERLESLTDALRYEKEMRPVRRTIGGLLIQLTSKGQLSIQTEPPRKRGRKTRKS